MASSSDWIAALGGDAVQRARVPAWIAAEGALRGFNDASPFERLADQGQGQPRPVAPAEPVPKAADTTPSAAEQAFDEGFIQGHAAGFSEAQALAEREMAHLRDLRLAFRTLDASAFEALSADLAATVLALCGEVLGGYASDPAALAERCRAAVARLGDAPARFALHLNPLDIAALGEDALAGIDISPDPAVARGSLRLVGGDSELHDGPDEWLRAIASSLGVNRLRTGS